MRSVITESTKNKSILAKAVVTRRRYRAGGGGYSRRDGDDTRRDHHKRSRRDESRSPRRYSNSRSGQRGGRSSATKRKRGSGSGDKTNKKPKNDKKGNSYSLPEPLSSILTPAAIMLVTALGFVIDGISTLHELPIGGRISHFYKNWTLIGCSDWVLSVVKYGYQIPLKTTPVQSRIPKNPKVAGAAHEILATEALQLKLKQAVKVVKNVYGEYISSYFAVPKPHRVDQWRPILNLKYFNNFVRKYRFSMESISSVREWLQPGYFAVSLDLKDAYLHIPVHDEFKKYLRFTWLGELLEWQVIPFGLTCSPRVMTKVLKPVLAFLRSEFGILASIYIDDLLIQAVDEETCQLHMQIVILVFMSLGWTFKWEKCSLVPRQIFDHLGFTFDTNQMLIIVPQEKIVKLQNLCMVAADKAKCSTAELERIIGTMESVRPAVSLAALHYRNLQRQLLSAKNPLRIPNKIIFLSKESLKDLAWWISMDGFAANAKSPIRELLPTLDIWSDANLSGGGAHCSRGNFHQRLWSEEEIKMNHHINLLEIRAAREGLKLASPGDLVRLHIDSQTAAAYIKKQGGTRSKLLCQEACQLWREALSRNLTLLTPHWLSTKENVVADYLSRNNVLAWEFQLSRETFFTILNHFNVSPTLDVFASKETAMLARYMSWYPDQEAVARDALIHSWDPVSYLFPPVPLIQKCLAKIKAEEYLCILVVPMWPTALWWPVISSMMVAAPLSLPHYKSILTMMDVNQQLPYLHPLVAVLIQGKVE